jgi:hypothetical protein
VLHKFIILLNDHKNGSISNDEEEDTFNFKLTFGGKLFSLGRAIE